jgi:hypothetical protein
MSKYSFFTKNLTNTSFAVINDIDLSSIEAIAGMTNKIGTPVHSDGSIWKATASEDLSNFFPAGVYLNPRTAVFYGTLDVDMDLEPNQIYYLGKDGGISRSNETNIIIGFSISSKKLFIDIQYVSQYQNENPYNFFLNTFTSNNETSPGIAGYLYDGHQPDPADPKELNKIQFRTDLFTVVAASFANRWSVYSIGFFNQAAGYSKSAGDSNIDTDYTSKLHFYSDTLVRMYYAINAGTLTPGSRGCSGVLLSPVRAYMFGGRDYNAYSQANAFKFEYTIEQYAVLNIYLNSPRHGQMGYQTDSYGYLVAGRTDNVNGAVTYYDKIDKYKFSDATFSTINLFPNEQGYGMNGSQSLINGYSFPTSSSSYIHNAFSKLNFATDSKSYLANNLVINRGNFTNVRSNVSNYICGGIKTNDVTHSNEVEKYVFVNETSYVLAMVIRTTLHDQTVSPGTYGGCSFSNI